MRNNHDYEIQAESDYQKALREAFWHKARQWLGRGCNDLLSFAEVFQMLKQQPQSQLGLQSVLLEQIVGSSGRSQDFDLAYRPRHQSSKQRWVNVAKAQYQSGELPPVWLYKVGDAYFVEDGNHRVSVARANGQASIQALVVEIDVSTLTPDPSCTRLGFKLDGKASC